MPRRSDLAVLLTNSRCARDLTLVEAAPLIGSSRNTLASWESGHSVPKRRDLDAIARVYGIDYAVLLKPWERASRTRKRRRQNGNVGEGTAAA